MVNSFKISILIRFINVAIQIPYVYIGYVFPPEFEEVRYANTQIVTSRFVLHEAKIKHIRIIALRGILNLGEAN